MSGTADADAVSMEAFSDAMRPLALAIGEYAFEAAKQPGLNAYGPAAESKARDECAQQGLWATPEWSTPARNAHAYGGMLVQFLLDHLSSIGATIAYSATGPAFAHLTLMRAIIESAPVAGWLLDPSIALETRLQRSCCYRLDNSAQMNRNSHLKQAKINANIQRIKTNAYVVEWRWRKTTKPVLSIGGESIPHPSQAFTASLWGDVIGDLDKTLWNYLSATIHGTWYALVQNLRLSPSKDPTDLDGAVGGVLIEQSMVTMYAVVAWRACANVVDSRARLMGWPMSSQLADAHSAMAAYERGWFEEWRANPNREKEASRF